jgi:tetratricopeptide (TPR) repeat protein
MHTTLKSLSRRTAILTIAIGFGFSITPSMAEAQRSKKTSTAAKVLPKRKAGTKRVSSSEAVQPVVSENSVAPEPGDSIEIAQRKSSVNVDTKNAIRLNYGRLDWNTDSTKIDEAVVFLREGSTGRIVQIQAEESAPDSAVFSGIYSINWRTVESLNIEFYAPPQKLLGDMAGRKKISAMIDSKELRRLPFVMRKDPITNVQNIELFDTADQARLAYKAYQSEKELLAAMKSKTNQKDQLINTAAKNEAEQIADTAMLAERAAFAKLSKDLSERLRLSQIEAQRLSQLIQKFGALTQTERDKNRRDAQAAADQAMLDYRANRFDDARKSFDQAVELDPTNRSYYFQYGVTLYKLEDFNRSLVYLDLAEGNDVNALERDFYRGLNYYRLKDWKSSLEAFDKVVAAKDSQMSPSANFYRGMIYFEMKSWPEARTEFQTVMDESKDPALDERAEAYIESILRQQQFDAERAKKWTLTGTFGALYDDNVILSSDSDRDRGTATDLEAFRSLLVGSVRYRPLYEETSEFAAQFDVLTMMSVGTSFQSKQTLTNADPTVVGLRLPWTHKGLFLEKGYKFDFVPGYELTYMSSDANVWKAIFNSYVVGFQNLIIMDERWYTNVNIDIRQDNANVSTAVGDDNSTALKVKLTWSNINFLEDKKQLVTSEFSYTSNNSLGKNSVFNRIDLGVGYVRPWKWGTTFLTKLSYFVLSYPENITGRADNSYTLTLGLSRPITEKLLVGFTTMYNINSSNVTTNQYKKLNLLLTVTANEVF